MVIYLSKKPVSSLTFKDYVILFGAIGYLVILLLLTFNFAYLQANICYNVKSLNNTKNYTLNVNVTVCNMCYYENFTDGFWIIRTENGKIIDKTKMFDKNDSSNI